MEEDPPPSQAIHLLKRYMAKYHGCESPHRLAALAQMLQRQARVQRREMLQYLAAQEAELASRLLLIYPELAVPHGVTRYTTAPEAFDGFGTATVRVLGTFNGEPLRQVDIVAEHLCWQTLRYASGLHPCFTKEELASLRDLPWFKAAQQADM